MKRLDLYIIRKFLGTFFFSLALILCIVVVFDVSERLEKFIEYEAPLRAIIFDYYMNFIPYFANVFSALFTFISVIFFTSKMAYDSEIIAILSTGISFNRFFGTLFDFSDDYRYFIVFPERFCHSECQPDPYPVSERVYG